MENQNMLDAVCSGNEILSNLLTNMEPCSLPELVDSLNSFNVPAKNSNKPYQLLGTSAADGGKYVVVVNDLIFYCDLETTKNSFREKLGRANVPDYYDVLIDSVSGVKIYRIWYFFLHDGSAAISIWGERCDNFADDTDDDDFTILCTSNKFTYVKYATQHQKLKRLAAEMRLILSKKQS